MSFPITVDFGENGGAFRLRTADDLKAFLETERVAWEFVRDTANRLQQNNISTPLLEVFRKHLISIASITKSLDQENLQDVEDKFSSYFLGKEALPISTSPAGTLVSRTRKEINDRAALGTLAVLMSVRFDADDPSQARGAFIAHEFLQGTGKAARQSVQAALTAVFKRASEQQVKIEERADSLGRRVEQIEATRKRRFGQIVSAGKKARIAFSADTHAEIEKIRASATEAVDSIRATEKVYAEHMGLEAPVTYWRAKSAQHKINARIAAIVGLTFAAAITGYAFIDGATRVLDLVKQAVIETKQWQVAYVVLTMVIFVLTVAFWIGRLVSRTYVSESHLAIDAEERAVMVQTYLALTKENKISETERVLVLGSLFRSSSDGLVKDDAAPDMGLAGGLAGLVSRAGANPGPATR